VINLVSRRPSDESEAETLINVTTRGGRDLTAYTAAPLSKALSGSITGGYHHQDRNDLDQDGWIDMPGFERWTARPRLFWNNASGASVFATLGAMTEQRTGGTLPGRSTPDGNPFPQTQVTDRFDGGLVAEIPLEALGKLGFRGSGMTQDHRHRFGATVEDDRHNTLFAETSLSGEAGGTNWVAGLAYQIDSYRSKTFPQFDYTHRAPGVFAQIERDVGSKVTLSASARLDDHNEYGTQFSPRLSLLHRPGPWTIRASAGRGFFAPTPFVEEIEAAGLSRLEPLGELEPETAITASLDIGYAKGPVEANLTLFASNLKNTTELETRAPDRVRLINAAGTSGPAGPKRCSATAGKTTWSPAATSSSTPPKAIPMPPGGGASP
jgi:iron complex outermembrane receptor protein